MPTKSDKEVIDFLSAYTGLASDKIDMYTNIEVDLGVTGDDGDDLLSEFSTKFNVDISEVNPSLYFGDEGLKLGLTDVLKLFYRLISKKAAKSNLETLLVEGLVEAVEIGKLSHKGDDVKQKQIQTGFRATSLGAIILTLIDQSFLFVVFFVIALIVGIFSNQS